MSTAPCEFVAGLRSSHRCRCVAEAPGCQYDQEAGQLWDVRASQVLVHSGFAVVFVNPYEDDSWDAGAYYDWWQVRRRRRCISFLSVCVSLI